MTRVLLALMTAASLLLITGAVAQQERVPLLGHDWDRIDGRTEFGERYIHRGAVHRGRLFISGGFNDQDMFHGDVWSSADGTEWRRDVEFAPWPARMAHGMVSHDGMLYVMGGYNGELMNDVWKSRDGEEWQLATEAAPWSPRSDFQVVSHGDQILLMGGRGRAQRFADVWSSLDGKEWTLLNAEAWPPRSHFGAATHNGRVVILGGGDFDYADAIHRYHRDAWASDDGRTWELLNDNIPMHGRVLMDMVSVGPYLYAVGGNDRPQYSFMRRDIWISPDGAEWMRLAPTETHGLDERVRYELRINHVLLAKDDALFIIGGHRAMAGQFRAIGRYAGEWRADNVWMSSGEPMPEFVPAPAPILLK
jgi:hypothetical protein